MISIFIIFGIIGLLSISIAIWLKDELQQNMWFAIGGIALFIYSVNTKDIIFSILQIILILSAVIELVKIGKKKK
jgi:hypothetical protein